VACIAVQFAGKVLVEELRAFYGFQGNRRQRMFF
jgi:hypothetical protein